MTDARPFEGMSWADLCRSQLRTTEPIAGQVIPLYRSDTAGIAQRVTTTGSRNFLHCISQVHAATTATTVQTSFDQSTAAKLVPPGTLVIAVQLIGPSRQTRSPAILVAAEHFGFSDPADDQTTPTYLCAARYCICGALCEDERDICAVWPVCNS